MLVRISCTNTTVFNKCACGKNFSHADCTNRSSEPNKTYRLFNKGFKPVSCLTSTVQGYFKKLFPQPHFQNSYSLCMKFFQHCVSYCSLPQSLADNFIGKHSCCHGSIQGIDITLHGNGSHHIAFFLYQTAYPFPFITDYQTDWAL